MREIKARGITNTDQSPIATNFQIFMPQINPELFDGTTQPL